MNTGEEKEFQDQNVSPRWETVTHYLILTNACELDLSRAVSKAMTEDDWELHGSPFCDEHGYYQAIKKTEIVKHG